MRSFKTARVTAKNLKEIIRENVTNKSTIMTDEFLAYKGLGKEFYDHQTVNHGTKEYVRGNAHTNTAEGYFSLLKRGINGVYHHVSKQHLNLYLNEFNFRYNRRKIDDSSRVISAVVGTNGKRLMLK